MSKNFLFSIIIIIGIVVLIGVWAKPSKEGSKTTPETTGENHSLGLIGETAPNFVLKDLGEKEISLSSFFGKPIWLIFMTTWCSFCSKQRPIILELSGKYPFVNTIFVDIAEKKEIVENYAKENKVNLPILLDSQALVSNLYSISGTPTHIFINKEGKIAQIKIGYTEKERLEEIIGKINK